MPSDEKGTSPKEDFFNHYTEFHVGGTGATENRAWSEALPRESGVTVSRTWTNTPGWYTLGRIGPLPTNSYSYDDTRVDTRARLVGTREYMNPSASGSSGLTLYALTTRDSPAYRLMRPHRGRIELLRGELDSKLVSKMKSNQFNVPIFAAEAGKTVVMVEQAAEKLVSLMRALRRGDFPYFLDNLRVTVSKRHRGKATKRFNKNFGSDAQQAAASAWLEYAYGWTPFMSDVQSAVNTVMDAVETPEKRLIKVHARTKSRTAWSEDITIELTPGPSYATQKVVMEEERRGMWCGASTPLDWPGRFGLTNPAEIVWELVPLSFVADWFLPIGDYLSALDVDFRFTHHRGSYGYKRTTSTVSVAARSDHWNKTFTGIGQGTHVTVQRDPMNSLPRPELSELTAQFGINARRATSAVALMSQFVDGWEKAIRRRA